MDINEFYGKEYGLQEDTDYMAVIGHRRLARATEERSAVVYRLPEDPMWIPNKISRKIDQFADAGYWWQVWIIPVWLAEEEGADDPRNIYERRFDRGEELCGASAPIRSMNRPWIPNDRASWLRGQVRQLVSEYGVDWARDRGLFMSQGTTEKVVPKGVPGEASIELRVPDVEGAEEVVGSLERALGRLLEEVEEDPEMWKKDGHLCWAGDVYAPTLVI